VEGEIDAVASLTYQHVTKRYGGVTAVDDLVLEVRDGEFMVLVGPSGCGKSTVLRLTAGLEEITDGDLYIGERRVNDVPARDRDIAMVFQNYALYPHLSVYENLAFGLRVRKTARSEREIRVRRVAQMLDIVALLDRKPGQLSGGQRQRVALGRAIVREPRAFLMDEPLSNLDAKLRVQTRGELIRLHRQLGTTTVYVTHDQVEAMTMGERIAVMRDGVVQQVDTPSALYAQPANVFVAGFIGTPTMNLFPGELQRDESGRMFFRGKGLSMPIPTTRDLDTPAIGGQQIILGVRPEHITDPREARGRTVATALACVNVVEPLGSEVFVYLAAGGPEFIARLDARYAPRPGQEIEVAVVADRVHLFDPVDEQALGHVDLQAAPSEVAWEVTG
jgi:multiple sugar transport system ATP-binding protein